MPLGASRLSRRCLGLPPTSGRRHEQRHDEHPNEVAQHNTRNENHKIRHQPLDGSDAQRFNVRRIPFLFG